MSQAVRRESSADLVRGAYQVLFQLGRGGMGTVFLARAVGAGGFERLVVVKRLNQHLLDQPAAIRRFLDEARIAARVHHANVIGTQQVGTDDDGPFLVLDYVEGGSLEELLEHALDQGQLMPPPIVLRIALDALAGLHAVHTAQDATGRPLNILHRDVSLQNVLIGRDGVARIADFGIAKSALGGVTTDKSYVIGKLLYMPREYLCREKPEPTLDVYALGITLWLALSAHELWSGASEAQLITHIVEDRVPPLSTVMSIPPQIEQLVATAVNPDPAQRFPSARAMAEDIERLARQTGWVATHAEVAQFLETALGDSLRERRAKLAGYIQDEAAEPSLLDWQSGKERAAGAPPGKSARYAARRVVGPPGERPDPKLLPKPESDAASRSAANARSIAYPHEGDDEDTLAPDPAATQPAALGRKPLLVVGAAVTTLLVFGTLVWSLSNDATPENALELGAVAPAARGAALHAFVTPSARLLAAPKVPADENPDTKSKAARAGSTRAAKPTRDPNVQPDLSVPATSLTPRKRAPPAPRQPAEPATGIRKNPYR